jgi:glycosyltransferase involved in cell wall biosynthesis
MLPSVLLAVGSLTIGGTEKQLLMLAQGLKRRGWSVIVFALDATGALAGHFKAADVEVVDGGYRSSFSRPRKIATLLLCQIRLVALLIRNRPQVVHGFLPIVTFMTSLAGYLTRAPFNVISKRAMGTHQDRIPPLRWLDWTANRLADVITANSAAVANDTAARDDYPRGRIYVIPNGLDFDPIDRAIAMRSEARSTLGIAADEIAMVTVANLIPYKGHADLIRAFARVAHPQARLFLVGRDDGIGKALEQLAGSLGVGDRIVRLGQRSDVPFVLAAMDIGVMASDQEGLSNAVLEKLAIGLPVVATAAGGNQEALDGMPGCVLVRPHDPDDLARGIESVVRAYSSDDRGLRCKLARERYSVDGMVDAHERLYRSRGIELPDAAVALQVE